jgi:hypothetical protein
MARPIEVDGTRTLRSISLAMATAVVANSMFSGCSPALVESWPPW